MTITDLLADFGRKAGLGSLSLDESGVCRLSFDQSLIVDLEFDSGAGLLHIYSAVGPIPAEGKEAVFGALLSANLFGSETGGASLAIDPSQNEIILCRSVNPDHLDSTAFEGILESFVNHLEVHRERLDAAPTGAAPSSEAPMPSHMLRA